MNSPGPLYPTGEITYLEAHKNQEKKMKVVKLRWSWVFGFLQKLFNA